MNDEGQQDVRRLLERAVAAGRFPGAIALWGAFSGPRNAVAVGRTAIGPPAREVDSEIWFDLASLTKPLLTTTLTLQAFDRGDISPSTRVGEVLNEIRNTRVGDLELHRLLTHTAGLPAWLPLYCLAEGQRQRFPRLFGCLELENQPGARVVYSCVGFIILGLVLERLAGSRLADLFRREVLRPAGLEGELGCCPGLDHRNLAGGASKPVVEERLAAEAGFDPSWVPAMEEGLPDDGNARFFGGVAGNAGLFGTARGVQRLMAEFAGCGAGLLKPGWVERAVSSRTSGLDQERAFGWQIAATANCSAGPALPREAFGHTGFTGVSAWGDGVRGRSWVLLTNRNHPSQRGVDLNPIRRRFHALAR